MTSRIVYTLVIAWFSCSLSGFATDFQSLTTNYTVDAGQVLTNELWVMAKTINLQGQAMDDLVLISKEPKGVATNDPSAIQISGTAHGNVLAVGESIETSGVIERHSRLFGYRFIQAGGRVGHNLIAVGGAISLPESANITGDALLAGREVMVEGNVAGRTRIYADNATLSGNFGGDVTVVASTITVMPGTRISGNLYYRMEQNLILDSNVALQGKLIRMETPAPVRSPTTLGDYVMQLALCMAAILVGVIFAGLFPGVMGLSLQRMMDSFWKSMLIGFIAFCLIPMTSFFLLFTLVGIPLSILAILAYIILLYLGKVVAALYLGHWLVYRRNKQPILKLFPLLTLGMLTLYAATMLSFPIDILVWFTFTLLGMGALVGAILDRRTPIIVACSQETAATPPPPPGTPS